ncbi:MAG TPA: hypothetical protein VJV78_25925 [Polyangiales bacterium]|nr:hypothetical protein [Polyangiales bacterium]
MSARGLVCLWLAACSAAAPEAAADGGEALNGSFNISLIAPSDADPAGHTALLGKLYDGPTPARIIWELAAEEGDCRLLTPRTPFCEMSCGGSAACVEDGVCQDYPSARSAGRVRVLGVRTTAGALEFSMDPIAGAYQPAGGIKLPYLAFEAGDSLQLQAASFTIRARGIAPLEVGGGELLLEPDRALELSWDAAQATDDSRVQLKLDISHHGGSKGMIECDLPDTGGAQLPAALVTQLLELGIAGFPTIILTRVGLGHAGDVAFRVESKVERSVTIAGLTSCTRDGDCSEGAKCRADLTCG